MGQQAAGRSGEQDRDNWGVKDALVSQTNLLNELAQRNELAVLGADEYELLLHQVRRGVAANKAKEAGQKDQDQVGTVHWRVSSSAPSD
jgi:hypothetical protein